MRTRAGLFVGSQKQKNEALKGTGRRQGDGGKALHQLQALI